MDSVFEIINVFSERYNQIPEKCTEDFYTLSLLYQIDSLKTLIPQNGIDGEIHSRDILSVNIYYSADVEDDIALKYCSSHNNWDEFIVEYNRLDKTIKRALKIEISKDVATQEHSIYSFDLFSSYLKSCNVFSILGQLCEFLNSDVCVFEFQEDHIPHFSTSKFHFHGKGKKIINTALPKSKEERNRCISKAGFLCSSTEFKGKLIPDDIFPISSDNAFLKTLFDKLSTIYALCFLLDYTFEEQNYLSYKLNGFKSIAGKWALVQDINENTANVINRIYTWGYNGGDIDDKILIIRNILSLNVDPASLVLHSNTFDAILSNYKIYQKENVRQYLDLRNNVVKNIQRYQDSILEAIDDFENTFKKLSISLLSFFFISVVLSILSFALSSNRHIPDAVILCCMALCVISLLYYKKERKWLDNRIKYLEGRFKSGKKYFEDLLGKEELKNFFEEGNDSDNKDEQFRNHKIDEFSNLWKWSTGIILAVLLLVLILNHIHPLIQITQMLGQLIDALRNLSSSIAK